MKLQYKFGPIIVFAIILISLSISVIFRAYIKSKFPESPRMKINYNDSHEIDK